MFLLHADHAADNVISEFLHTSLGTFGHFLDEVILHGLYETAILIPFLFLTYLLMEYIEHTASDKVRSVMTRAGTLGPLIGGLAGAAPQCGFSASAANLYTGRVITLGTLVAVFISTSDEMIPILVAGNIGIDKVLLIVVYKIVAAIIAGFAVDLVMRILGRSKGEINIDEICEEDGCHCEDGVLKSAIHHTVSVSLWCFGVIVLLNAVVFFVGEDLIGALIVDIPVLSHLICSLIGLVPNCAASVALSRLAIGGFITVGEMISGLSSAAGIGLFVLFKMNKKIRENLVIVAIIVGFGVLFGVVADLIPFFTLS